MMQCNKCNVQYISETKCHLSDRFGEHRRAIEIAITQRHIDQPTVVSDRLTLAGHFMKKIELFSLELITSNRNAIRKEREAFLISKGRALEPSELNPRGGGAGVFPIMAYTGRLRTKEVPFSDQVYERLGISQVKVYKRVGKSVI